MSDTIKNLSHKLTSRRTFLKQVTAIGFTEALLNSCATSASNTNNSQKVITWVSGNDGKGAFDDIANEFNKTNKDGIFVNHIYGPSDSTELHKYFADKLHFNDSKIDIMSLDVVWLAEFANNKWTWPIDDIWSPNERMKYLSGPINACTFNNRLWAVPYQTDVGIIFYRKDLVSQPPHTWNEMTQMAIQIQNEKLCQYGYVWQGAQYEGLVCNFVEVLYGYGGSIFELDNPRKVAIDSPEAIQALKLMVSWVGGISPKDIYTYKEQDADVAWRLGKAAFMRNWPLEYKISGDQSISQVANEFDICPMLSNEDTSAGHSCIGGWQLGINAFSKNKDAAWKFINYIISSNAQKRIALDGLIPTLKSTYEDPDIAKTPFFKDFKSILDNATPRPVSPKYPIISDTIQKYVHQALKKQLDPENALLALKKDLEGIIASQ